MNLIQGYLFRQVGVPIVAATAALTGIGLLSQSLDQLEVIVERGQSVVTMAKLTLLAMPQLISIILPIGLFIGALIALTRLQREQELTAAVASGLSRWKVIAPMIRLAVLGVLAGLFINLFVQPAAQRETRQTAFAIRTDLAALLVEEGRFVQGPGGLTVYVQEIQQSGLIKNLFVYLQRGDNVTTWDAEEARFGRVDGLPVLTMKNGSMQRFSSNGVLNYLSFDNYVFDLSPFADVDTEIRLKPTDLWLTELLSPSPRLLQRAGSRSELLAEAHSRLTAPLYSLVAMAMALAAILGGAFSRTGYGLRIAKAAGFFLVVRVLGVGLVAGAAWNPWLNLLQWALPLAATAIALRVLFRALKPRRRRFLSRLSTRPA